MSDLKTSGKESTHPSILQGESVDAILKETERYRKECQSVQKQLSDLRVQSETQKRAIERIGGLAAMKAL